MDPKRLAIDYYFGDLQYWKLPRTAADALEEGFDGPALRYLAGIANPLASEMNWKLIDSAFREMGVDAPISKDRARLSLAAELAENALKGTWNVFDAATHLRIHLCEFKKPPDELLQIFELAREAQHAPRSQWKRLEQELTSAFQEFLERWRAT
ncbi:MAG: hypothetical protein WB561_12805 [Terracidiphilus sp.]